MIQKSASADIVKPFFSAYREATSGQPARESDFRQAFGKGHDRCECVRGRPAHENAHPQRLAAFDGVCMVDADVPPDLVMQPDLPVGFVSVA